MLTPIRNARRLSLLVAEENSKPTLRIVLLGSRDTDRTIEVIFPEHVTAKQHGAVETEHLYLFRPGGEGERPAWRENGHSLEYEMDLENKIFFLARATLQEDGVHIHYEFANHSGNSYDMISAVT